MAYAESIGSVYGCVKNSCVTKSAKYLNCTIKIIFNDVQQPGRTSGLVTKHCKKLCHLADKGLRVCHIGAYVKNNFFCFA